MSEIKGLIKTKVDSRMDLAREGRTKVVDDKISKWIVAKKNEHKYLKDHQKKDHQWDQQALLSQQALSSL